MIDIRGLFCFWAVYFSEPITRIYRAAASRPRGGVAGFLVSLVTEILLSQNRHHAAAPLLTKIREFPKGALNGKLVLTANTHGGGGLMHTREDFEKLLADSGAKLGTHLTVFGDVDEDDLKVRNWLRENNVL